MTTLTPTTSQDDCYAGQDPSPARTRFVRNQGQSRAVSGDRLTAVMLAADTLVGNFSRADLAAQGSLQSVSIGSSSRATTFSSEAPYRGPWSTTQTYNTAVGPTARAWGMRNTAIGGEASAGRDGVDRIEHEQATAVGSEAKAEHNRATALGAKAVVQIENGVVVGADSFLSEREATPIETGEIDAAAGDSIKTTYDTRKASAGGVSVGSYYKLRQIKNVADGTELTDAVTLRQLLDIVGQLNPILKDLLGQSAT